MRRFVLFLLTGFFLASACASAQQTLPSSFAGWTQSGIQAFTAAGVPAANGGAATDAGAAAAEYGLAGGEQATYTEGADTLSVTLYKMKDPTGAYGEYSYQRAPGMQRAELTDHSSIGGERALALTGNLVLDVQGKNLPARAADLKALVNGIGRQAQDGPLPTLWQRLPEKGVVQASDRYILGPRTLDQFFPGGVGGSIDFSTGAEAEVARYRVNGGEATLLLVDFPTPQMAEGAIANLKKKYNVNGSQSGSNSPALYANRSLTVMEVVAGASSQAEANALLGEIPSATVLTWNEPTFQFKEPSIEMMVVGAIEGTGVICLFALIAGLAFGGFRLIVKRALPGKVFDRTSHVELLQMGLVSKPIKAEDFYGTPGTTGPGPTADKDLPDRIALRLFR